MDQTYHVLLEGRKIGPYDRRTIVGMRIKKALASEHVLIGPGGAQLTVADLIGHPPSSAFNPDRSGSFSVVQATFTASLIRVQGRGVEIPRFRGEVQARVQGEVLRIAGRFRRGLGSRDGRVKLVLKDVVHARVKGSQVDLWLRPTAPRNAMQRISLELFTPESAGELVEWLPGATPWPHNAPETPPRVGGRKLLTAALVTAVALAGAALLIGRLF